MGNILCYSADGDILQYYTQWGVNQKLIIKGADTSSAPDFHFFNANTDVTYVVHSTISGNSIIAEVPDILLQYSVPLIVYIEYVEGITEYTIRIPILPKAKPTDYKFTDINTGTPSGYIKVIDNLTSQDPVSALSAQQGYVLDKKIKDLEDTKVDESDVSDMVDSAVLEAVKNIELSGVPGRGIVSIDRTSGDGSPGTVDTYTIKYTDDTTSTFEVYNGADGQPGASDGVSGGVVTIVNNLNSNDTTAALSAAQGSVINGLIEGLERNKVDAEDLSVAVEAEIQEAIESGSIGSIQGEPGKPGRGIVDVSRTSGDGSPGTFDVYTITYTDDTTSTFSVYNGADGTSSGGTGETGEDGATFVPHVDPDGTLWWTNDKELSNPTPVNIKGYTPRREIDYWTEDDINEIKSYVDNAILGGVW